MRGKKLVYNQQIHPHLTNKNPNTRIAPKRKLQQIRSVQTKTKPIMASPTHHPKLTKIQSANQPLNDYDWQRRQRQTLNFMGISKPNQQSSSPPKQQSQFRSQRNSNTRQFLQRQNNFMNQQGIRSQNSSQHRIKIFSTQDKQKSFTRSDNSSAKKRGIELTKTLLKRISGMYTDKDFQNKSSYIKSNRNSTGIILPVNNSNRVSQQYQTSDFDLQIHNNHTFNISINQLSINQSTCHQRHQDHYLKNQDRYQRIQEQQHQKRINQEMFSRVKDGNQRDSKDVYCRSNDGRINRGREENYCRIVKEEAKPQRYNQHQQSYHETDTSLRYPPNVWNNQRNSAYWHKSNDSSIWNQSTKKTIPIQQSTSRLQSKQKPRVVMVSPNPRKQLVKPKSYDLLAITRPLSQSIVTDGEPSLIKMLTRTPQLDQQDQRYIIHSKNRTLQQLSVKQSMVLGFDNYYQ